VIPSRSLVVRRRVTLDVRLHSDATICY